VISGARIAQAAGLALAVMLAGEASAAESPPVEKIRTPLDEEEDDAAPPEDPKALSHRGQVGLRAGVLFGYTMAFRYPQSPLCTNFDREKSVDDQQKVCGFGSGPATELALSYAVLGAVEPYVFTRLGFSTETNTDTEPVKLVGAGARVYAMNESRFKLFLEPGVGVSFEGAAGNPRWNPPDLNPEYKTDFLFHLGIGPQYDFARYVGVFASGNVDVGILRALTAQLNLHIGVQVRFP